MPNEKHTEADTLETLLFSEPATTDNIPMEIDLAQELVEEHALIDIGKAILARNVERVSMLLSSHPMLNLSKMVPSTNNNPPGTLLHYAVSIGHPEIVKLLLAAAEARKLDIDHLLTIPASFSDNAFPISPLLFAILLRKDTGDQAKTANYTKVITLCLESIKDTNRYDLMKLLSFMLHSGDMENSRIFIDKFADRIKARKKILSSPVVSHAALLNTEQTTQLGILALSEIPPEAFELLIPLLEKSDLNPEIYAQNISSLPSKALTYSYLLERLITNAAQNPGFEKKAILLIEAGALLSMPLKAKNTNMKESTQRFNEQKFYCSYLLHLAMKAGQWKVAESIMTAIGKDSKLFRHIVENRPQHSYDVRLDPQLTLSLMLERLFADGKPLSKTQENVLEAFLPFISGPFHSINKPNHETPLIVELFNRNYGLYISQIAARFLDYNEIEKYLRASMTYLSQRAPNVAFSNYNGSFCVSRFYPPDIIKRLQSWLKDGDINHVLNISPATFHTQTSLLCLITGKDEKLAEKFLKQLSPKELEKLYAATDYHPLLLAEAALQNMPNLLKVFLEKGLKPVTEDTHKHYNALHWVACYAPAAVDLIKTLLRLLQHDSITSFNMLSSNGESIGDILAKRMSAPSIVELLTLLQKISASGFTLNNNSLPKGLINSQQEHTLACSLYATLSVQLLSHFLKTHQYPVPLEELLPLLPKNIWSFKHNDQPLIELLFLSVKEGKQPAEFLWNALKAQPDCLDVLNADDLNLCHVALTSGSDLGLTIMQHYGGKLWYEYPIGEGRKHHRNILDYPVIYKHPALLESIVREAVKDPYLYLPEYVNTVKKTPLHLAIAAHMPLPVITQLIEHFPRWLCHADKEGISPLKAAIEHPDSDVFSLCLARYCKQQQEMLLASQSTLLVNLASNVTYITQYPDRVSELIKAFSAHDLAQRDKLNDIAQTAAFHGHIAILEALEARGANLDEMAYNAENEPCTPLAKACLGRQLKTVQYLLTKNPRLYFKNLTSGKTLPLFDQAASRGDINILHALLEAAEARGMLQDILKATYSHQGTEKNLLGIAFGHANPDVMELLCFYSSPDTKAINSGVKKLASPLVIYVLRNFTVSDLKAHESFFKKPSEDMANFFKALMNLTEQYASNFKAIREGQHMLTCKELAAYVTRAESDLPKIQQLKELAYHTGIRDSLGKTIEECIAQLAEFRQQLKLKDSTKITFLQKMAGCAQEIHFSNRSKEEKDTFFILYGKYVELLEPLYSAKKHRFIEEKLQHLSGLSNKELLQKNCQLLADTCKEIQKQPNPSLTIPPLTNLALITSANASLNDEAVIESKVETAGTNHIPVDEAVSYQRDVRERFSFTRGERLMILSFCKIPTKWTLAAYVEKHLERQKGTFSALICPQTPSTEGKAAYDFLKNSISPALTLCEQKQEGHYAFLKHYIRLGDALYKLVSTPSLQQNNTFSQQIAEMLKTTLSEFDKITTQQESLSAIKKAFSDLQKTLNSSPAKTSSQKRPRADDDADPATKRHKPDSEEEKSSIMTALDTKSFHVARTSIAGAKMLADYYKDIVMEVVHCSFAFSEQRQLIDAIDKSVGGIAIETWEKAAGAAFNRQNKELFGYLEGKKNEAYERLQASSRGKLRTDSVSSMSMD